MQTQPVGDHASSGWIVSWRRYRQAVLMPMRLDIEIDRAGRVSQLAARTLPDVSVGKVTVTKNQAVTVALGSMSSCTKARAGELLAVRDGGSWIPAWRVVASCGNRRAVININARTRAVQSRQTTTTTFPQAPRPPPERALSPVPDGVVPLVRG